MSATLFAISDFHARYARVIDSDKLEEWPAFFMEQCHYRVTTIDNENEGLPAGLIYATSRAMLSDRVMALRSANIFERQRYRHIIGQPLIDRESAQELQVETPFMVARIMATGQTELFVTGVYRDVFVCAETSLRLSQRVVVCDSAVIDTLLAIPL